MSATTQFDLSRDQILDRYHLRIDRGERTKLTREERDNLALLLVDRLVELNQRGKDDQGVIRELCEAEKALLERGYPKGSINSTYLPTYTNALKAAIDEGRLELTEQNSYPKPWTKRDGSESGVTQTHFALDFLTYDGATQAQLRGVTTAKNNLRQDDLKPVRVDAYLRRVQDLLESEEPEGLAIAIAALTGRRHAEVVSVGSFEETGHPYQLRFEGQQKKAVAEAFEIVSLIPGRELLPVIERFRSLPGVQGLVGLDDDHPEVQKFNSRVNRRVQALFGATGLVPVLEGFKSVSIHRLRALYGAIAVHFFCANNQHLHRFLQNHLGHVLTKEVGVGNSRATDHYFHYFLVKEDGTPLTARGVKLMAHGALVEMAQEQEEVQTVSTASETGQTAVATDQATSEAAPVPVGLLRQKVGLLRFPAETRDRWHQVLAAITPQGAAKLEQMTALLEWIEARIEEPSESQPSTDPAAVAPVEEAELMQVKAALEAVLQRLDKLEAERATPDQRQGRKPQQAEAGGKATPAPSTRKLGGAVDRANSIFLAVQAWNRLHPEQSFALTLSLLKDEFGINFKAARDFLAEKQNQIWELHQSSGVENARSHNRQGGRDIGKLKQFVQAFSPPSSTTTAAE
jgi:Telomere resolvase